jgi:hypothetical protein
VPRQDLLHGGMMETDEHLSLPPLPLLPVTRCEIYDRTVAYRPGTLREALTDHHCRAHPEAMGLAPARGRRAPVTERSRIPGVVRANTRRSVRNGVSGGTVKIALIRLIWRQRLPGSCRRCLFRANHGYYYQGHGAGRGSLGRIVRWQWWLVSGSKQ